MYTCGNWPRSTLRRTLIHRLRELWVNISYCFINTLAYIFHLFHWRCYAEAHCSLGDLLPLPTYFWDTYLSSKFLINIPNLCHLAIHSAFGSCQGAIFSGLSPIINRVMWQLNRLWTLTITFNYSSDHYRSLSPTSPEGARTHANRNFCLQVAGLQVHATTPSCLSLRMYIYLACYS